MLNQIDKRISDENLRSQNAINNKTTRITILDNIRKQNMLDTRQYLASDDMQNATCDKTSLADLTLGRRRSAAETLLRISTRRKTGLLLFRKPFESSYGNG